MVRIAVDGFFIIHAIATAATTTTSAAAGVFMRISHFSSHKLCLPQLKLRFFTFSPSLCLSALSPFVRLSIVATMWGLTIITKYVCPSLKDRKERQTTVQLCAEVNTS